jgi:CheY-like chemotaxis protein
VGVDVLVVDDSPEVATFARLILQSAHSVVVAHGGRAALASLADTAPDVVVLDLDMPDLDGWEVLRRIRNNAALKHTRVLLYTPRPTRPLADHVEPDAVLAKDAGPRRLI